MIINCSIMPLLADFYTLTEIKAGFCLVCISAAGWHRHNTHPGAIKRANNRSWLLVSLLYFGSTNSAPPLGPALFFFCIFFCFLFHFTQSPGLWLRGNSSQSVSQPSSNTKATPRRLLVGGQPLCDSETCGLGWDVPRNLGLKSLGAAMGYARGSPSPALFDNFVLPRKNKIKKCKRK